MYNLLNNYSIINYNGIPVRNILTKIKFDDIVQSIGGVFYPYVISEGERPDNIAANYYDDPRYSWLVYMSNNITDPYHEWPLSNEELNELIRLKYGSMETAQDTILYWKNNWEEDDTVKDVAGYNVLSTKVKKYFKPVLGYGNSVISYIRADKDNFVETNIVLEIAVADSTKFVPGDLITQYTSSTLTASGQVKGVTDTSIVVVNALGAFAATAGNVGNIRSKRNTNSAATLVSTINNSIPLDELVYWKWVDAYSYEFALNESKRSIKLIDKDFVDQIEKEINNLL